MTRDLLAIAEVRLAMAAAALLGLAASPGPPPAGFLLPCRLESRRSLPKEAPTMLEEERARLYEHIPVGRLGGF